MKEAHSDLESAKQEAVAIANTLSLINADRGHALCSAESFLALRASQLAIMSIGKAQVVLIDSGDEHDAFKEAISMDSDPRVIVDTLVEKSTALETSLKSMCSILATKPLYKLWVEQAYVYAAESGYWINQLHQHVPQGVPEPMPEVENGGDPLLENTSNSTGKAVMTVSTDGNSPAPENLPAPSEPGSTSDPVPETETTNEENPNPPTPEPSANTGTTDNTTDKAPVPLVKRSGSKNEGSKTKPGK